MQSVFAALSLFVAGAAFAASEGGYREHGAHEHGHGTLDVAVEGEELVIEFRIPAVNAVGFEHAPGTDAERAAVRQALAQFGDPSAVLVPSSGAECAPERAEAGFSGMGLGGSRDHHEQSEEDGHEQDSHEQGGHAHGKHGHDRNGDGERGHEEDGQARTEGGEHEHEEDGRARNRDEDEHHEHGHGHDEHHDDGHEPGEPGMDSGAEAHSELYATYHFHCHAPEQLDRIQVRVFELLHDAEEIEVRVVTPTLQKAMDLHPGETIVELSR